MKNELEALASELPILTDKSSYKYLSEVAFLAKVVSLRGQWNIHTKSSGRIPNKKSETLI